MTDDGDDRPTGGAERADREPPGARPTLSTDGAYALLWGVVSLLAAGLAFDGSVGLVVGLAGFAGVVGLYSVARDLLQASPPTGLEYLWMGTPALLAAGIAALDGRLLTAGGLGVVALATLIEGYGWFGAGEKDVDGVGGENESEMGGVDGVDGTGGVDGVDDVDDVDGVDDVDEVDGTADRARRGGENGEESE